MITGDVLTIGEELMTARFTSGPSLSGVRRAEDVSADDRDIWPTPDGPNASKSPVQPHRHCAGCGRWLPLTRDGRIPVHDAGFSGECQGSRKPTDLTGKLAKKVEKVEPLPPHVLAAVRAIVNALRPGGGRTNRCESEDELRHRFTEDGAEMSDKIKTLMRERHADRAA
jgi:hypothetical protein